jgi:hypothetical protein
MSKSVHQGVKVNPKGVRSHYGSSHSLRRQPMRVDPKSIRELAEVFDAFADSINRKHLPKKKK